MSSSWRKSLCDYREHFLINFLPVLALSALQAFVVVEFKDLIVVFYQVLSSA